MSYIQSRELVAPIGKIKEVSICGCFCPEYAHNN